MKSSLKIFFDDLRTGKNLDIYVSIMLGIILAILGVFNVINFTILAAGILATLTVLLFSMLSNRRDEERLNNSLTVLEQQTNLIYTHVSKLPNNIRASDVIKSLDAQGSLEAFLIKSKRIFMAGVTLYTRTNMLKTTYKRMLSQGCDFQFIVLDPLSPILPLVAMGQSTSVAALRGEIDGVLNIFKDLKEYTEKQHTSGKFEFITFNYAPTLTYMKTENLSDGEIIIHVELPAYHSGIWERPSFRVTKEDKNLFAYFDRTCTELWIDATLQQKDKSETSH